MRQLIFHSRSACAYMSLSDHLKHATREIHAEAEQRGVVARLLSGAVSIESYACYLRNLAEIYRAMEQQVVASVIDLDPVYFRFDAIASDLALMVGDHWASALQTVPATQRYRERIVSLTQQSDSRLIAHYYVRYMGDLYGGQIIRRRLAQTLGLRQDQLTWYCFDRAHSLPQLREKFRATINTYAAEPAELQGIVDEAVEVFRHNIAQSVEVATVSAMVEVSPS